MVLNNLVADFDKSFVFFQLLSFHLREKKTSSISTRLFPCSVFCCYINDVIMSCASCFHYPKNLCTFIYSMNELDCFDTNLVALYFTYMFLRVYIYMIYLHGVVLTSRKSQFCAVNKWIYRTFWACNISSVLALTIRAILEVIRKPSTKKKTTKL